MPFTILCIDDEQPGLEIRKRLLQSAGYRVLIASSGTEGIRIFKSEKVDMAIVDYWMAGMNGIATARELKRLQPFVPVVMLSALAPLPDEFIGLADTWIRKGEAEPEHLITTLNQLLQHRPLIDARLLRRLKPPS